MSSGSSGELRCSTPLLGYAGIPGFGPCFYPIYRYNEDMQGKQQAADRSETMSQHDRSMRIMDIGFQVGTGRANLDIENAAMEAVGVDSLGAFPFALKAADDLTVTQVWEIVCGNGKSIL